MLISYVIAAQLLRNESKKMVPLSMVHFHPFHNMLSSIILTYQQARVQLLWRLKCIFFSDIPFCKSQQKFTVSLRIYNRPRRYISHPRHTQCNGAQTVSNIVFIYTKIWD